MHIHQNILLPILELIILIVIFDTSYILIQDSYLQKNISFTFENYKDLFPFPYFKLSDKPKSYDKCKLCKFIPNNGSFPPNSTPRDAIFVLGLKKLTNLLPVVKTLRTVGSKCRFFLFTDNITFVNNSKASPKFFSYLEDCGVEFVNIGKLHYPDFFFHMLPEICNL